MSQIREKRPEGINPPRPDCFPDEPTWQGWLDFGWPIIRRSTHAYCRDCTLAYQREMVTAGMCGNPYVVAGRDDERRSKTNA